jgi:hypothetical protein
MKIRCLIFSIGLLLVSAAVASAAGPAPEFKIKEEYTVKSPDGETTVEQYFKTDKDDNNIWQFWARRSDSMTLLGPEQPDYPADFRFTRDSRWLVRLQKTGSGEGSMFLYRLGPAGFVAGTKKPFSDLAWNYFYSQRASRKIRKKPEYHINVGLLKGIADNYSSLGENWPDSRYILIGLSGDADVRGHQTGTINGWQCRYDLQQGKFDVPKAFLKPNAEALVPQ